MAIAKRHHDKLQTIKDRIELSYDYFRDNYNRFNAFRKFVFETTLSPQDISLLSELGKPQIEFNILEAYISRLLGEFSKQEPSIAVEPSDGKPINQMVIDLVEGHMRSVFDDASTDMLEYDLYKDMLCGGFSVAKVYTEYSHERSMDQVIRVRRAFDPTMCGFDPMGRKSHKGDGQYCFELFPMIKEAFEDDYGTEYTSKLKFVKNIDSFSWSYANADQDIVLVADFYEKKKKKGKIVQLVNGQTMTTEDYDQFVDDWNNSGQISQPPGPRGKARHTDFESICRYRMIDNTILEYSETIYKQLPLVFFDGNSAMLRNSESGGSYQMTRPYIYNAKGAQQMKNFAGQTLANELENMVMHKFKVAKESIPLGSEEAYENVQRANVLLYNAFKDNDPNVPLPPPMEIARVGAPPEVTTAFQITDSIIQGCLGSYDASLGINDNQLSGVALVEGATQGNAASMPYITGYLKGMNRCGTIIVDLIPKVHISPRSIPVKDKEGKKGYHQINHHRGMAGSYGENDLNVIIKAGVNFSVQKSRNLQHIEGLMQASQSFAQFMNEKGLKVLVDNLDIEGGDQLSEMASQYMTELQQQKQQAQQMAQQQGMQNPLQMKMQLEQQKLQQSGQEMQMKAQQHQSQVQLDFQKLEMDKMRLMADMKESQDDNAVDVFKAHTELSAKRVQAHLQDRDMTHKHAKDTAELAHHIIESNKPKESTSEYR